MAACPNCHKLTSIFFEGVAPECCTVEDGVKTPASLRVSTAGAFAGVRDGAERDGGGPRRVRSPAGHPGPSHFSPPAHERENPEETSFAGVDAAIESRECAIFSLCVSQWRLPWVPWFGRIIRRRVTKPGIRSPGKRLTKGRDRQRRYCRGWQACVIFR